MSRLFYHVMQDNAGNLLFDVSGTMRLAGTGTLATIFGDEALTIILPNPMTNHPTFGSFKCFLPTGDFDFYMAKSGYTFETLTGIQGYGSMAQQEANAVAITGGTAVLTGGRMTGLTSADGFAALQVVDTTGNDRYGLQILLNAAGGTNRKSLHVAGTARAEFVCPVEVASRLQVGVSGVLTSLSRLSLVYPKDSEFALSIQPTVTDAGTGSPIVFGNIAGTAVGSIGTSGVATTYNTTSDGRLKCDVEVLSGALDMLRQLRPITHRWKADGSRGYGFLAHEVQETFPDAGIVTGERDAIDDSGNIVPQMIDPSKLVVWLVSACQALAARVEVLEQALG